MRCIFLAVKKIANKICVFDILFYICRIEYQIVEYEAFENRRGVNGFDLD